MKALWQHKKRKKLATKSERGNENAEVKSKQGKLRSRSKSSKERAKKNSS